ncbi:hypothetical protein OG909_29780 [Streptomyces sp. NBC_01754]|uniref:hypothetical protein n=1 Tax=Streptomyces sp. NBC_01754 TaxID=2975930 RepID=UPI002DD86F68|nr:hypothetical protein [Streptomyces sp. NBC_01754]WSC96151.1 hypothetical protein OG909_29780 [Streptomyces sp. NBC_01754]
MRTRTPRLPGRRRAVASVTAVALAVLTPAVSSAAAEQRSGTGQEATAATAAYYVDCSATGPGDGTRSAPWNSLDGFDAHTFGPGDQLLFKRGTTCGGTLETRGSGSAQAPFTIASYGDSGERAVIDGAGAATAVHLFNQEHVVLQDLEIVNAENPGTRRRGISVQLEDFGTGRGYTIRDIYMHDVAGDDTKGPDGSQGIAFLVTGEETPTTFENVQILGNTLERVDRQAVNVQLSTWNCRPEIGCTDTANWLGARQVVIRGNHLSDIGGDGIVVNTTVDALVEGNTVEGFNRRSGEYNAGIWPYNANGTLAQFNDVSGGKGTKDGMAYDIDGGTVDSTFQYNLSHDNEGGFFLLCTHDNIQRGSVVRYNISQNDHHRGIETCRGEIESAEFHNNTIYIGDGVTQTVVNEDVDARRNVKFRNNIVYKGGGGTATFKPAAGTGFTFGNNVISSWVQNQPANPGGTGANPLLCNPGHATGPGTVHGYRLQAGSPAIDAGAVVAGNGGRDFSGAPVGDPPNIGAIETVGCG